jgi:hypothetical protein
MTQKLGPFFPPLEPLQAKNLRNALYRSLDALKKDGILGREAVLRKTMLEECKGDKFFELLALFSGIVLKKALASRPKDRGVSAVASKLATASTLSSEQQQSLLPLAIAHKAALVNVLKRKDEKRRRFAEFATLLDAKATEINHRIQKCRETPRARKLVVPQKEAEAIKKQLKENWVGNQKWLDVMLYGDDAQGENAFLTRPFSKVWHAVEQGHKMEHAVPETGLLENLQLRVEQQQSRLQKWQDFHGELQKEGLPSSSVPSEAPVPAREFRFDDHLQFQLRSDILVDAPNKRPLLRSKYHEIISELDDELAHIATRQHNHSTLPQIRRCSSSIVAPRSPARRTKSRSDSISDVSSTQPKIVKPQLPSKKQPHKVTSAQPSQHNEAAISSTVQSAELTAVQQYEQAHSQSTCDFLPPTAPPPRIDRSTGPTSPSLSPSLPSTQFSSDPPVLEPASPNNEEVLAAQIVSAIGEATPSPTKKAQPRMSLMERTRLSMAPHTFNPIPESPSLPELPLPSPLPISYPQLDPQLDPQASLLERTRLSMAAMSARPRASLAPKEKRRSTARQSIYPVNQFDTPRNRKSIMAIEEAKSSGQKTPKEDLFSDQVDYDRVFKSRPRVATSPVWGTPDAKGGVGGVDGEEDSGEEEFDEGVTGVDLADVDADENEDGDITVAWENSPSRGAGKRALLN